MQRRWKQVADHVNARMAEIPIDQAELARRAGVSHPTVRGLMKGKPRAEDPRPGPLRKVSVALGWTPDSIDRILAGGTPRLARTPRPASSTEARLAALEAEVEVIAAGLRELSESQRELAEMAHTHQAGGQSGSAPASVL